MIVIRLFIQTVFLALGQIWSNKVRAMLTTLGIIIGVAAVLSVVAGLTGLRGFVLKEFETFGARKVWAWGYVPEDLRTSVSWSDVKLSPYEIRLVKDNAPSIDRVTAMMGNRYDVSYGKRLQRGVETTGVWPDWHEIEGRTVIRGRELSRFDDEESRQVCLINEKAIEELNLPEDPTGEYLLVKGRRFLVIGVLETKQQSAMFGGGDSQSELIIPFNTQRQLNPYRWINMMAQLTTPDVADDARAEMRFILRKHRGLDPEDEDTFRIEVLQNAIDQFNGLAAGITAVAGAVVSIALLVGGIGIMNIMLVSVSERTREIGLRKAVGARPGVVLMQFLVEAVTLCVAGGVVGVTLGFGITEILKAIPNSPMSEAVVPDWAVYLSFGFCGLVGVVFGMFPAIKAARLNPIDALRHD
ncbi:MAG: ABC transporter permease [Planctomycetota bacterium]